MTVTAATASVEITVDCDGRAHPVTVTIDPDGNVGVVTPAHHGDTAAEAVLAALGCPVPPCQTVTLDIERLRRAGHDAADAARWIDAAGDAEHALAWAARDFTTTETRRWRTTGATSPADVDAWHTLAVWSPEATAIWKATGVNSATDAAAWAAAGVTVPDDLTAWARAGITDPTTAAHWTAYGATGPDDTRHWQTAGVTEPKELRAWLRAGIHDPADLAAWKAAGVTTPAQRHGWHVLGVTHPTQLDIWHHLGLTDGIQAARWAHPRLITSPDEIPIWRAAGIHDPDQARKRLSACNEPDAVRVWRTAALRHLHHLPDGTDGRKPLVLPGADPALHTEIFFYAYGHHCIPAHATHWIAIDFHHDRECGRRTGTIRDPRVATWSTDRIQEARHSGMNQCPPLPDGSAPSLNRGDAHDGR